MQGTSSLRGQPLSVPLCLSYMGSRSCHHFSPGLGVFTLPHSYTPAFHSQQRMVIETAAAQVRILGGFVDAVIMRNCHFVLGLCVTSDLCRPQPTWEAGWAPRVRRRKKDPGTPSTDWARGCPITCRHANERGPPTK